jgi:hypothetical protein
MSSHTQALHSVLNWADDLAQFSIAQQLRLSRIIDASGRGVNGEVATATFEQQYPRRPGTLEFKRVRNVSLESTHIGHISSC